MESMLFLKQLFSFCPQGFFSRPPAMLFVEPDGEMKSVLWLHAQPPLLLRLWMNPSPHSLVSLGFALQVSLSLLRGLVFLLRKVFKL